MDTAQFQQGLETKIAELNARRSQAEADVAACTAQIDTLSQRISDVQVATTTLASLPPVGPLLKWRDHLPVWRKKLCDELLACPEQPPADRATVERRQGLRLSILNIDRGCSYWGNGVPGLGFPLVELIQAAGYKPSAASPGVAWFGSLPEVEDRIGKWTKERDEAQARLDDALLDDNARAKQDTDSVARRDRINAMSNEDGAAAMVAATV